LNIEQLVLENLENLAGRIQHYFFSSPFFTNTVLVIGSFLRSPLRLHGLAMRLFSLHIHPPHLVYSRPSHIRRCKDKLGGEIISGREDSASPPMLG